MSSFLQGEHPPLILASASESRARILEAAGLAFTVEPPGVDEDAMRKALADERPLAPHDVAEVLARAKAEAVSERAPKAYVIGGDQVLAQGERIFAKPDSMEAARRQLLDLSGKQHALHTAVAVATKGKTVWAETTTATLTMRTLSPAFIGRYLAAAGEDVVGSVGAYQLESLGIHLFEQIEGDHFSILGLPLNPLLDTLRREGVIEG